MLFNSYIFILLFLPASLAIFYLSRKYATINQSLALLVVCSLFFYAWWEPTYLILILGSAIVNFFIGKSIALEKGRFWYVSGLVFNVGLLGYFKYLGFFVVNFNLLFELGNVVPNIVLPLAISFFTFQQIAYLTSCKNSLKFESSFVRYLLFISFFPQLIAGPIVHHNEIFKQFDNKQFGVFDRQLFSVGICIFIIGLVKKVLLADQLSFYVDPVFTTAAAGGEFSNADAWTALMAYKFQLYFDFSGYADMAIGLGLMFGIRLPINFESPYKAKNMFDFWNRWHTTLARFMRSHVYRPLSRVFTFTTGVYLALILNIIIGGVWHGASWNFALWGLFNAFLLVVNHLYRRYSQKHLSTKFIKSHRYLIFCIGVTFFATTMSSVLFRSENLQAIERMYINLFVSNAVTPLLARSWFDILFIASMFAVVWFMPNTKQIFQAYKPGLSLLREKTPTLFMFQVKRLKPWLGVLFGLLFIACLLMISKEKEFIYFQF